MKLIKPYFLLIPDVILTMFQGHILTIAGVTVAICASPFVAALNLVALAAWPTWIAVAVTETIRKVQWIRDHMPLFSRHIKAQAH
jgi:hypothetical protein